MPNLIVPIKISSNQYLSYYQGKIKNISARSIDGRQVIFPANVLKPYVTSQGVSGVFKLNYDNKGKLESVDMINDQA